MSAIKINPETLEPDGTVIMPGTKPAASVAAKEKTAQKKAYFHNAIFIPNLQCRSTRRRAEHHLHRRGVHKPDCCLQRCKSSAPAEHCYCHQDNMHNLLAALQKRTQVASFRESPSLYLQVICTLGTSCTLRSGCLCCPCPSLCIKPLPKPANHPQMLTDSRQTPRQAIWVKSLISAAPINLQTNFRDDVDRYMRYVIALEYLEFIVCFCAVVLMERVCGCVFNIINNNNSIFLALKVTNKFSRTSLIFFYPGASQ